MRPLTPPTRSLTPPSLCLAAEVFEDIPTGMTASESFKDAPLGHGKSMFFYRRRELHFFFFFSIGTGAFLRDPSVCGNLEDFHIWVGFNPTYERGSYLKRTGYTPLSGRFDGCAEDEIVVVVSDHRTSGRLPRNVQLNHLVPARPVKMGDYVVILSGDNKGRVAEVIHCQRKDQKVKIIIDNRPFTYNFALVCRLTRIL